MELTKDTPITENTSPDDPHQTGSGNAEALGGKDAPVQSAGEMSHGGEAYPGPRAGGETDKLAQEPGDTVHTPLDSIGSTESADGMIPNTTTPETTTAGDELPMGDLDPGGTRSADETGQGGDPAEPAKNKAHPWNG